MILEKDGVCRNSTISVGLFRNCSATFIKI